MPKKLPNGKSRTFVPNIDNPRNDLQAISPGTALLISKNWMQNILLDVMTQRRTKKLSSGYEFVYDDLHIMSGIQELQKDIEESQKKSNQLWTDVLNDLVTSPPTLWVGEFKSKNFGLSLSNCSNSFNIRSKS